MSVRRLFALLAALSVLFSPAVTAAAMAASPHHQMQMMEAGHCQMPAHGSASHDKMGKSCCIAMCMAVAVEPTAPAAASPLPQQIAQFAAPRTYVGVPAEIATPPPRGS
jgi:hypothetical protein